MEGNESLRGFSPIQEKELRVAASMNKSLLFELLYIEGAGYALRTNGGSEIGGFVLVTNANKRPRLFRSLDTGVELIKSFNPEVSKITITIDR